MLRSIRCVFGMIMILFAVGISGATVYTVNSLADTVAVDRKITLREAIEAANTNANVCDAPAGSLREADVINFDSTLFNGGAAKIALQGSQLEITDDLIIKGPGMDILALDGESNSRIIQLSGSGELDVDINDLEVRKGQTVASGGGVYNINCLLTLRRVRIKGCIGTCGSALYNDFGTVNLIHSTVCENFSYGESELDGSAIFNHSGSVLLSSSMVLNNWSYCWAAGISSDDELLIYNSVIAGNYTELGLIGGIYSSGNATIRNSTIAANRVRVPVIDFSADGITSEGQLNLYNCIVSNNYVSELGWEQNIYRYSTYLACNCLIDNDPNFIVYINPFGDGSSCYVFPEQLRLLPDSPAIDTGDTSMSVDEQGSPLTSDVHHAPRVVGTSVDIGAYEYQRLCFMLHPVGGVR